LSRVHEAIAKIPATERRSIYVARGPTGLEAAVAGAIASEVVDLLGARNVVAKDAAARTIVEISPEQFHCDGSEHITLQKANDRGHHDRGRWREWG
jgi:iron complex transport system substrate-binding protein